jgi:hypothetical protein
MAEPLSGPLAGDGAYERDHFTCIYCGFDGRTFDAWMQLSIDHVRPRSSNGGNEKDNLAVACGSCNRITCRMKFDSTKTRDDIIREKREFVKQRREHFYALWMKSVAPRYLDRPLPNIHNSLVENETPEQVPGEIPDFPPATPPAQP